MGIVFFIHQKMKISIFLPIFCLVILAYLAEARPSKLDRKGSSSSSSSESGSNSGSGSKSGSGSGSCSCETATATETATRLSVVSVRLSESAREDTPEVEDRKK